MGSLFSKIHTPLEACAGSVTEIITGRKRKREDESDTSSDEVNSILEKSLNTPKRKKLLTTTQYIYQALFKEHRNSDIAVMALGKVWRLHKVYLCQSAYFASMFGGSWRETAQNFVNIEIIDPKINLEALDTVFGSLYLDEVTIDPKCVISVLATATHFQLDGLIERCAEVMTETVNAETSIQYYDAACEYGVQSVKSAAFNWLLVNLLSFYSRHSKWLRQISVDLMTSLVKSADLFVVQTEFSLYMVLRCWAYINLHPNYDEKSDNKKPIHCSWFAKLEDKTPFLLTKTGRKFEKPFRHLRLPHLLSHPVDLNVIIDDNLIPRSWLNDPLLTQWHSMLQIDQSCDSGPLECDRETFLETCCRCGRVLFESGFQKWRWTGFNYGIDLVLITDSRTMSIKRHHRTEPERLLSLQTKRNFLIRVTLTSINEQRQVVHTQTTDIKMYCLEKNSEEQLMVLDKELEYPLFISVNMLVTSPTKIQPTTICEESDVKVPISNLGSANTTDGSGDGSGECSSRSQISSLNGMGAIRSAGGESSSSSSSSAATSSSSTASSIPSSSSSSST